MEDQEILDRPMIFDLGAVLDAHGGSDRWREFSRIRAKMTIDGTIWGELRRRPAFADSDVEVLTHEQAVTLFPTDKPNLKSIFRPNVLHVRSERGEFIDTQYNPRASFREGLTEDDWDDCQKAYVCSYSVWNCLTQPFLFSYPGVEIEEVEDESAARHGGYAIKVTYPSHIASHSSEVTVHFGPDGRMTRQLFRFGILGGEAMVSFPANYQEVQGIRLPMSRMLYRQHDLSNSGEPPVFAAINIRSVEFS